MEQIVDDIALLNIISRIYISNRARVASTPINIEGKTVEPMEPKSSMAENREGNKPANEKDEKITFDWKEEIHSPDE